jgi:rhodanese-related sulfurtransferase
VAARPVQFRLCPPLDTSKAVAVHGKSGYRSMLARNLLQRAGYPTVTNAVDGFDAWGAGELPDDDQ